MTDPADPADLAIGEEDRALLQDSVRGFLERHWPAEQALVRGNDPDALRRICRQLAGQGLTAMGCDQAAGGLREAAIVMQALGRAACPAPVADAFVINRIIGAAGHDKEMVAPLAALRDTLADGSGYVCLGLTGADPDANAGTVCLQQGRAHGRAAFLEGAAAASHYFLALEHGHAFALVEAGSPAIERVAQRALGTDGLWRIDLAGAPVLTTVDTGGQTDAIVATMRVLLAARALGAAERAFELAVDYAQTRRQFGRPVGAFQAVQHKLADNLIALTGVRLAVGNAADHHDRGAAGWLAFADALWSYACDALKQATLNTHHVFGAIGYAEDHEAPRHFRRVHLDTTRLGGARITHERLASRFLDGGPAAFPDFDLGPQAGRLRDELRAWLAEHWPAARREAFEERDATHREFDAAFARELGETGWIGLTWPQAHGGMARSPLELLAYMEEMERAGAPRAGAPIQSAALMLYGSPDQQRRYLPELLRGEVMIGMFYSEPDSGSDLASIRTSAVFEDGMWVINGQKIWTTTYWGDYMWLAARTDPNAKPPHAGISMFLLSGDTPGISRVPMRTMYDGEFCNTFFDDVRVPADALVGSLNGGWQVLVGSLGTERAYVGGGIAIKTACQFEEFCELLRHADGPDAALKSDPLVRQTLGGFAARIEIGRLLALNSVSIVARGQEPTWEAAMAKVFAGETMEAFCEAALEMLGMRGTLSRGSADAPLNGRTEQKLRHSLMWVISIGTNDIQRNLIALRGLGLPR
ncbi:MAG: acyl-CoA dehydrogenase family protein [Burkholderiaceae bacterium]